MKRFILLLSMIIMLSGCGYLASHMPELSPEQKMAIAAMADERVSSEIASHGESNPYLPVAGGAGAGATVLALLKLYSMFRKKYKRK